MGAAVTCVFQAIKPTPVHVLQALKRWTTITVPRVSTTCYSYLSLFMIQHKPFTLRGQLCEKCNTNFQKVIVCIIVLKP